MTILRSVSDQIRINPTLNQPHKINLSKLRRCPELWDSMELAAGGRSCERCSKTIVDFSEKSDSEIAMGHLLSETPICGFYSKQQLGQEMIAERSMVKTGLQASFFSLISVASANNAIAQSEKPSRQTEQTDIGQKLDMTPERESAPELLKNHKVLITGMVKERLESGGFNAVPFANLLVKGSEKTGVIGTSTDIGGHFSLDVTALGETTEEITLIFNYIGFAREEKLVSIKESLEIDFIVSGRPMAEGEVDRDFEVVTYSHITPLFYASPVIEKIPWHKRVWRNFIGVFKKK